MAARNKRPLRGSVELLLALPSMALLAWGAALVFHHLRQAGRLERAAWVYEMSGAHQSGEAGAEKQARAVLGAPSRGEALRIEEAHDPLESGAEALMTFAEPLPAPFRFALLTNLAKQKTLKLARAHPPEGAFWRSFESAALFFEKRASVSFPANEFRRHGKLKYALWADRMNCAEFGYPLLQGLGAPELIYIASGHDTRKVRLPCLSFRAGSSAAPPPLPSATDVPAEAITPGFGELLAGIDLSKFGSSGAALAASVPPFPGSGGLFGQALDYLKADFAGITREKGAALAGKFSTAGFSAADLAQSSLSPSSGRLYRVVEERIAAFLGPMLEEEIIGPVLRKFEAAPDARKGFPGDFLAKEASDGVFRSGN